MMSQNITVKLLLKNLKYLCAYMNMRDAMERLTIMENTVNFLSVVEALRKTNFNTQKRSVKQHELKNMKK